MKSLVLYCDPTEAYNILRGDFSSFKCKKFPKNFMGWVYIYCLKAKKLQLLTGPDLCDRSDIAIIAQGGMLHVSDFLNGTIVAKLWCNKAEHYTIAKYDKQSFGWSAWLHRDGLNNGMYRCYPFNTEEEITKYKKGIYIINFSHMQAFNPPKQLSDFNIKRPCGAYRIIDEPKEENFHGTI